MSTSRTTGRNTSEINPTQRRELLFPSNLEKACWIGVKNVQVEVLSVAVTTERIITKQHHNGRKEKMLNSGSVSVSTGSETGKTSLITPASFKSDAKRHLPVCFSVVCCMNICAVRTL
jgi:hypothetical protein